MDNVTKFILGAMFILAIIAIVFMVGWVFAAAWNITVAAMFALPKISTLQGVALWFVIGCIGTWLKNS